MAAAYMQILIHAVNGSLFPNADPSAITWTGPPPGIVTVQTLLYASLATSLFASFIAMLGKQWVNRYIRNRGGSATNKSRDRQRKLDGLEKWYFHLTIESLPVILQFALLLLGCALARYLWLTSRTVAGVILTFTLFGGASYTFFTLIATFYYNCPYQTPLSVLIRTFIRYLEKSNSAFARSLRSHMASFSGVYSRSVKNPRQTLRRLRSRVCSALRNLGCVSGVLEDVEHIPLAVAGPPRGMLWEISIDWDVCKTDTRCIFWVLDFTTDNDVIYSTARFAADMTWYPEIAGALSPVILAENFLECLLDGRIIPGRLEHASAIGMALASILSISAQPGA